MPKVGDKEFSYDSEGIKAAAKESMESGIPISNGAERSVQSYAGGGKTGYDAIGRLIEKAKKSKPLAAYVGGPPFVTATNQRLVSPSAAFNKAGNPALDELFVPEK